ncbi:MAG: VWA domain-containing protein [Pseudomonadota bacterium]
MESKANSKRDILLRKTEGIAPAKQSSSSEVSAFLNQAKSIKPGVGGKGRVILALDATMSRQPTWDMAARIQAQMFHTASETGSLSMQLVYFRGFGECRASAWANDAKKLSSMMSKIDCRAGQTQIAKVLKHCAKEHAEKPVSAIVYIGDAMEENPDTLGHLAGQLGMRSVPLFLFQEGDDRATEVCFKELARLTRGGWFRFDRGSPDVLSRLLSSIARYATGGLKALKSRNSREDRLLLEKLSGKG